MDGSTLLKMMFGSKNDQQLLEVWFRWDLVFAWTPSSSGLGSVHVFFFLFDILAETIHFFTEFLRSTCHSFHH